MDNEAFRRSITNGTGRPVLWLANNPWRPHAEAIENVCRHNTAYDPQCEGSRAEYVHDIISLTDDPEHFVGIAADALERSTDYWDLHHLYHLSRLLAEEGHFRARDALYDKFDANNAPEPFIGAGELIRLDGEKGLRFVLKRIGRFIESHPDHDEDDQLLKEAAEVLGNDIEQTIREASTTDIQIRRYIESVDRQRGLPRQRKILEYRRWTYFEMKEHISRRDGNVPLGWLREWGRHASEAALLDAATDLPHEGNARILTAFLRIFSARPFPLDPLRLVELVASEDTELSTAALRALRHLRDSTVRDFAVGVLCAGKADGDIVRLLVKNYKEGDQHLIAAALDGQDNEDDFHWTAHAAAEVFEANPNADAMTCVQRVYEKCRCSICRMASVKSLMLRRQIPEWMTAECRHDSYPEVRSLINK